MMIGFAPLRALGWTQPPMPVPAPAELDPIEVAVADYLTRLNLYPRDAKFTVCRKPDALRVSIFLRERSNNGDRTNRAAEAQEIRNHLRFALALEGYMVRFTDAIWCDLGARGWSVTARAKPCSERLSGPPPLRHS